MSISSLFQFIIGFFVGIIFFTAGIAGGAYFFLTNVSQNPDRPIFAEEKSSPQEKKEQKTEQTQNETKPAETQAVEEKEPEPTAEESESEELPAGAYFARVTWSTGLSLRDEPSLDATRVGGVGYNSKLIILSTSPDGDWQKVRLIDSGQEAWVKAGNVAKVEEE